MAEGCPCANETAILASLSDQRCRLPAGAGDGGGLVADERDGIRLTVGGSCVPFEYGSSNCLQHDLLYDPSCRVADAGDKVIPAYCFRPFCYVDRDVCKRESEERVYRSGYFAFDSGVDLFYSYSACNSTAEDWLAVEEDVVGSRALGAVSIEANVPSYLIPMMFKRGEGGEILSAMGSEYYDDAVPFEGAYISYITKIAEISNGDIEKIAFTHRSRASSLVHPTSSFTASVQDIQDGLVDMAVGPFWITSQRLKMAAFSLPVVYDKTFLVIPRPGTTDTLSEQTSKVLAPFSYALWGLVLVVIFVAAALSVWFFDKSIVQRTERRMTGLGQNTQNKERRRKIAYARLTLDSFLQKGLYFCSAGVEQDEGAGLPYQLLMFGFGFFILIAVSAYVANLAAFLTLSSNDSVKSMERAVAAGLSICAHPALMGELQVAWPSANFYFHAEGNEFHGVLDDYEAGRCKVVAVGYEDTGYDRDFLERLCNLELVYTDSLIIETPIGFPIRPQLAAGLSYWMIQGERKHDTTIETAKEAFAQEVSCDVLFKGESEASEYDEITVKNMFFPLVFFACCALIAILLQIRHLHNMKHGRKSLLGHRASFDLVEDATERRQRTTLMARIRRSSVDSKDSGDDWKDDPDEKGERNERPLRRRPIPSELLAAAECPDADAEDAGAPTEEAGAQLNQRSIMTGVLPPGNDDDVFVENGVPRAQSAVRFKAV